MSNRRLPKLPEVRYSVTTFGGGQTQTGVSYPGGLDQVTPTLRLEAGAVRSGVNFECMQSGGYGRIAGYERVDGQPAPSAAAYTIIQIASFASIPAIGDTVTQDVSGATGVVCAVTGNYIAVTKVVGSFDTSHDVFGSGTGFAFGLGAFGVDPFGGGGSLIGTAVPNTVVPDARTDAQTLAAAADIYRAAIQPVPGSGPVLGVVHANFNGVNNLYAFRADASGMKLGIYRASPAGWVQVPFFNLQNWTSGIGSGFDNQAPPLDGETLTQGGVTATIQRVMWQSGSFAASPNNTAVGAFVITNPIGGNFAAGPATTTSGVTVTLIPGGQEPIAPTVGPGSRFEFTKCNFSGQESTRRIYGCDTVNPPFEFDGVTYAPIETGLVPNAPTHIYFHKNYLFITQKSSLIGCGAGTPYKWSATDGGFEIATGDIINGMITLPGSQTTATLAVFLETNTAFLYGTDPTTFNYVAFNTGIGAVPYSMQNLFDSFALDTLGVITLRTTLNWGNFLPTTLTKNMLPFILQERNMTSASCIFREKSSYRLFFSDGYGLWLTMVNQQYLGGLPVLFPNPVFCVDEDVTIEEEEVIYFGSSDHQGYVYQMEKGNSFDGEPIIAYLDMAWDQIKSPRILKRFRAASLEIQGQAYAEFDFGYQLGYDTPLIGQPPLLNQVSAGSPPVRWDSGIIWDQFAWDGAAAALIPSDVDMTGTAENVRVVVSCGTTYVSPFTLNSVIYHYSMRRGIRV